MKRLILSKPAVLAAGFATLAFAVGPPPNAAPIQTSPPDGPLTSTKWPGDPGDAEPLRT